MCVTLAVDMWSVGCIMAELLTGQVLFPGADHIDQLTRILQIVGSPDTEFMQKISSDSVRTNTKTRFCSAPPNAMPTSLPPPLSSLGSCVHMLAAHLPEEGFRGVLPGCQPPCHRHAGQAAYNGPRSAHQCRGRPGPLLSCKLRRP